ncbi:hypothetical protein MTO96_008153 [Rhipicephalus appendiculatus]
MAGCASPPEFEEATDHWPAHLVRLEAFFEGNGIMEEKKKRMSRFGYETMAVLESHGRQRGSKRQRGARMVTAETPEGELVRRHFGPSETAGGGARQRATAAASLTRRRQSRRQHDDS